MYRLIHSSSSTQIIFEKRREKKNVYERAPTIGAMLWQNVNRWRKISRKKRESEKETEQKRKEYDNFVRFYSCFACQFNTHNLALHTSTHARTVLVLSFLQSVRAKSRLFVCQFEPNFSNITPYFLHWHTRALALTHTQTQQNCQYIQRSPLISKWRRQYQWFHLTFFQFNTFSIANTFRLNYTSADRSEVEKNNNDDDDNSSSNNKNK